MRIIFKYKLERISFDLDESEELTNHKFSKSIKSEFDKGKLIVPLNHHMVLELKDYILDWIRVNEHLLTKNEKGEIAVDMDKTKGLFSQDLQYQVYHELLIYLEQIINRKDECTVFNRDKVSNKPLFTILANAVVNPNFTESTIQYWTAPKSEIPDSNTIQECLEKLRTEQLITENKGTYTATELGEWLYKACRGGI